MALVITYRAAPGNWLRLRTAMQGAMTARLTAAEHHDLLSGFTLYYNRDVDSTTWSGMAVLDFQSEAALERFRSAERQFPAGLAPAELALTNAVDSTESEAVRQGAGGPTSSSPLYLVIPYHTLIDDDAYRHYLDGYTIPQLRGWMDAGVLSGYSVYMSSFPAGRPWSAMLILRYRDADGLAKRDAVKAGVRAKLANDPVWAKYSSDKGHIRDELPLTLAEVISHG